MNNAEQEKVERAFDEISLSVQQDLGNWASGYLEGIKIKHNRDQWGQHVLIDPCIQKITFLGNIVESIKRGRSQNVDIADEIAVCVAFLACASEHETFGNVVKNYFQTNENLIPTIKKIIDFCHKNNVSGKNVFSVYIDGLNTVTIEIPRWVLLKKLKFINKQIRYSLQY